jgi:hypothetical protein
MGLMTFTTKFSTGDTVYMVSLSWDITSAMVTSITMELRPGTGNTNPVISYGLKNSNIRKLESELYTLDEAKALVQAEITRKENELASL